MNALLIEKVNEVYCKVYAEDAIRNELSEYFTYEPTNSQFKSQYNKHWDGSLKLFDRRSDKIYIGLIPYIRKMAEDRGYEVLTEGFPKPYVVDPKTLVETLNDLKPGDGRGGTLSFRPYQLNAIHQALKYSRRIILSPTGSGKSLIIYALMRLYGRMKRSKGRRALIIVPRVGLTRQLLSDFQEYSEHNGWDAEANCHLISSGVPHATDKPIVISTWQSIYENGADYFKQFDTVICDEVHEAEAKSIKGIMEQCVNAKRRIGLTGTLRDAETHVLTLEGLFGKAKRVENTRAMMDRGELAMFKGNIIFLEHHRDNRLALKKELESIKGKGAGAKKYKAEMDYLCAHAPRNLFIKNLALRLKKNTLVLFNYVESHGMIIRDLIERDADADRKVYFIYGGTDGEQREKIRKIVEQENDAIIIASFGTFSTGINIKNLHNIILTSPSKSKVRILQSVGRGVRAADGKDVMNLYDVIDDMSLNLWVNKAFEHGLERVAIYDREKFDYEVHNVGLPLWAEF